MRFLVMIVALWSLLLFCPKEEMGKKLVFSGLALSAPLHYASEVLIHAITPIRSGASFEVVKRAVEVSTHLTLVPMTLPMAAFGALLDKLGSYFLSDYLHLRGTPDNQAKNAHTFFSLNACMLWGGLPIPCGGLPPARTRVDKLCKLLQKHDPDFILLQEVAFSPALHLYKNLKAHYKHFYTHIGSNSFGIESCLFFASKQSPQSEPFFIPFEGSRDLKRGVFVFEAPSFWILTTHLSPGDAQESSTMRKKELACILKTQEDLKKRAQKPCFLLGDLYIMRGGTNNEYFSSQLKDNYFDPYLKKFPEVNAESATFTHKLTSYALGLKATEKPWEIDDFALLDIDSQDLFHLDVEPIETFSLEHPANSLSDHRGLLLRAESAK